MNFSALLLVVLVLAAGHILSLSTGPQAVNAGWPCCAGMPVSGAPDALVKASQVPAYC
jgi:hypothetical protein